MSSTVRLGLAAAFLIATSGLVHADGTKSAPTGLPTGPSTQAPAALPHQPGSATGQDRAGATGSANTPILTPAPATGKALPTADEGKRQFDQAASKVERTTEFQAALKAGDKERLASLLNKAGAGNVKIRSITTQGTKATVKYSATWVELAVVIFIIAAG